MLRSRLPYVQNSLRPSLLLLPQLLLLSAAAVAVAAAQPSGAAGGADLGVCVGSSAAAKLLARYAQSELRQPRLVRLALESGARPWFEPVAHVESRNRIAFGQLRTSFKNNHMETELRNVTLRSASNIYLIPLPFFLGKDTAHITVQMSRASLKLRALRDFDYVQLAGCALDIADVDIRLDNAPFLNVALNPLHRYLLPGSLIRDAACGAVESALVKLRRRFAVEIPLASALPAKFVPYLLSANVSLFLELEAINADDDQLTVSASVEWAESPSAGAAAAAASAQTSRQFFAFDEAAANAPAAAAGAARQPETTVAPPAAEIRPPTVVENVDSEPAELDTVAERLQLWVRDSLINELFDHFRWDFEWMEERIPVESPKLPQSTSAFLSTLCTNCYFLLRVSANGAPHVQIANSSVVLKKSDQIYMKVVNPTRNVDAVFVNFALTLSVRLTPSIEAGVFRTQVDLLETDIRMQEGAFPAGWTSFVQDLVKGMIMDVIWPSLKKDIETLSYSDGVQIPIYCGLEPASAHLHFDEAGRVGASAALHLDDASLGQCLQQLRSKLPDPAKLLVIHEKKRRR